MVDSGSAAELAKGAYPVPQLINGILVAAVTLINATLLIYFPLFLTQAEGWALLLVPLALTANTSWYLIHDSFHGNLFRRQGANAFIGRFLAVFFGAPWGMLRFFHLMHHAYNRCAIDRPDFF